MWISLLALEQVVAIVECRVLVERVADGEHHVGFEERLPRAGVAAVAEDADRQRMVLRDDALAVERGERAASESARSKPRTSASAPLRMAPKPTSATTFLPLAKRVGQGVGDRRRRAPVRAGPAPRLSAEVAVIRDLDAVMQSRFSGTWIWTGPGRPSKARFTASSRTSHRVVDVGQEPAASWWWPRTCLRESGVRFSPEVSLSEPLPLHSSEA